MIAAFWTVILVQLVAVVGALDSRRADRVALYVMGVWLNVRRWAWPNGPGVNIEREHWRYRGLHHRRGSPAMVGQPRPAGKVIAELRRGRAALAELAAARLRVQWDVV